MNKNIKNLLTIGIILSCVLAKAQTGRVGVNTSDPKSTMDINGKTDAGGILLNTDMTGLQAPRLNRAELTAKGDTLYGTDQKGTLIYITDVSAGTATSQRINIKSPGYYYFDGALWQKLLDNDISIYTADGSLTGATSTRTLTLNSKAMTFTGNQQATYCNSTGSLSQQNIQPGTGLASFSLYGGNNTQLSFQQFYEGTAQIYTSTASTSLDIGTNAITPAGGAPIRFLTSAGGNALGTEKARITPDGKIGIMTTGPSETFDVGSGNVRVRDISSNTSTDIADKIVVADASGVLKTKILFVPFTALTGFRNTVSGNLSSGTFRTITMDTNPLLSGMTYNSTTGQYTVNSAGYYQIAATVSTDVSMNNPSGGTAIFRLRLNGSVVNSVNSGYLDGSVSTNQNMVYVVNLSAGDVIDLQNYYTRTHRVTGAQISAIKLSN